MEGSNRYKSPFKGVFRELRENKHGLSLQEVTDVGREYEAVEKLTHYQRGFSFPLVLAPKVEDICFFLRARLRARIFECWVSLFFSPYLLQSKIV